MPVLVADAIQHETEKPVENADPADSKSDTSDTSGTGDTSDESSESTGNDTFAKSVQGVEDWCRQALGVKDLNSLWFQRFGEAYQTEYMWSEAISYFKKAAELPDGDWYAWKGLTESLDHQSNRQETLAAMGTASKMLENSTHLNDAEKSNQLLFPARWYSVYRKPKESLYYSEKALEANPDNNQARLVLMKHYLALGRKAEAKSLLFDATRLVPSQLGPLIQLVVLFDEDEFHPTLFKSILLISEDSVFLDSLLRELETGIRSAIVEGRDYSLSCLMVYKGMLLHHRGRTDLAVKIWEECWSSVREISKSGREWALSLSIWICSLLSEYHFEKMQNGDLVGESISELEIIIAQQQEISAGLSPAKAFLSNHYQRQAKIDKARAVCRSDATTALHLLTDNSAMNDWEGYYTLASMSLYIGDEQNAFSAYSHVAPSLLNDEILAELLPFETVAEQKASSKIRDIFKAECASTDDPLKSSMKLQKEAQILKQRADTTTPESEGDSALSDAYSSICTALVGLNAVFEAGFNSICDNCQSKWGLGVDAAVCWLCHNVDFCLPCVEKIRNDRLEKPICSPSHNWFVLPKVTAKRYADISKRRVPVGGQVHNGVVTGNGTVSTREWIQRFLDDWGMSDQNWDLSCMDA
jgi:tetratricopeptide (TPR) repeat protein